MSTRENERTRGHQRHRGQYANSVSQLALDLVRDDPNASKPKLERRLVRLVQEDEETLNECLEAMAKDEIAMALNTLAREKSKAYSKVSKASKAKGDTKKAKQKAAADFAERIAAAKAMLFNAVAENGKKMCDLTGNELVELAANNATRAKLYLALSKHVKGDDKVSDVLTAEKYTAIVTKIGDTKELSKLFG